MNPRFGSMAGAAPVRRRHGWRLGAAVWIWGTLAVAATNPDHWAFQPLVRPVVPASGYSNAVDAFVSSALGKTGGTLARDADRATLIRRLSFDLRGLPPSPEEVAGFVEDTRPGAFERLVEAYLESPRYGERWGRHWLDIVGYADSNGYFSADSDRPLVWKYRDYAVRSLNADKPIDRFVQEQIAGDELVGYVAGGDVTPGMVEALIATHFWRNAPDGTAESDGNPLEVKVDKYAVLEGNVQILGAAFLGLTLQCSRCHDHKFEPVTQEEYYGLQAILRPAFDPDHWLKPDQRVIEIGRRAEREAHHRIITQVDRDLKALSGSLEGLTAPFRRQVLDENLAPLNEALRTAILTAFETREKERTEAMKALLKTNAMLVDIPTDALMKRFPAFAVAAEAISGAVKKKEGEKPPPLERIAATFEPTNAPPPHHVLVRGNHANEGKEAPSGTPAILQCSFAGAGERHAESNPDASCSDEGGGSGLRSTGRRLALAHWLTSSNNPVVARVLVNRVWHYHFGRGLAGTVDNLGRSGAPPVCRELLDWLASEFIRSGWSLKRLHRLILESDTWKQACNPEVAESALTRSQPSRLDAESLRDAMLAVSGELDLTLGGPYVPTRTDKQGQVVIDENQPGAHRRSLYLQQRRTHPVEFLSTFDGPAHNPVCVQRVSSTVALQSLSLLNSEFVRLRARAFANRVLPPVNGDSGVAATDELDPAVADTTLRRAFELAYLRPPATEEAEAAGEFLRSQSALYHGQPEARLRVWTDLCQMLLASNPFLYVD